MVSRKAISPTSHVRFASHRHLQYLLESSLVTHHSPAVVVS
jgi:hypothetical protein